MPISLGLFSVILCAILEGAAQIAWKESSRQPARKGLWIVIGSLIYAIEIPLYTYALRSVDVTVAFAVGSLSFVAVALFSRLVLGEKISRLRAMGLLLILCGVTLVGGEA